MENQVLTLQEAAKLLKVSDSTLRSWIKRGKIPAFREGHNFRIKLEDIERRFKKQTQL